MANNPPRLPLKAEYHDGGVEAVEVGPRREVTISVLLDPVWNNGDESLRRLRFSAIWNFEEVSAFFASRSFAEGNRSCIDRIMSIVLVSKGVIGIEFDTSGYVEIHSEKVQES